MAKQSMKRLVHHIGTNINLLQKQESYGRFVNNLLTRCQSQWSKGEQTEKDGSKMGNDEFRSREISKQNGQTGYSSSLSKYSSDEDDLNDNTWKLELDWITKALEPALQLCRRALPAGDSDGQKILPGTRSLSEIVASIQRSKTGIEDWSLSDLTVGLYLIYLRQASTDGCEDIKGIQISSNAIVQDLIYHTELAKGAYKGNATGLARNSMLREQNVLKFIKTSSVMRPGYYIGIDTRNKLVILGIRGTHTVYDLITDIASSGDKEVTFEGYSSHFGTAEAARWFLCHEIGTLRKCLEKHEGYRLRIVGHSLGGAAAALLAIMLRKKTQEELGFNPDIVSAFGIGTPPCLSKELAESCSSYVSTVVMQDDIIPRLSVKLLRRLRNEILQTDWMTVLEQEDWKSVVDMVTNAKQVVSSVQGAARKFADYASFKSKTDESDVSVRKDTETIAKVPSQGDNAAVMKHDKMPEELFVPGTVYFLKRDVDKTDTHSISSKGMESYSISSKGMESYTLWKRHAGEHFERIVLSSNLISDHKCDNHYYALRDVLKGLPSSDHD